MSIAASLLVTQQGFSVCAQVIGGMGKGAKVQTGAGSRVEGSAIGLKPGSGTGTSVSKIELRNIGITNAIPSDSILIKPADNKAVVGTPADIAGLPAPASAEIADVAQTLPISPESAKTPLTSGENFLEPSLSQGPVAGDLPTPASAKSRLMGFGRKIISAAKSSKTNVTERLSRQFFDGNTRSAKDIAVVGRILSGPETVSGGAGLKSAKGERGPPTPPGPPSPQVSHDAGSGKVKAYLTRHGEDPVAADLGSLAETLAADPAYVASLNKAGRVRVVTSKGNPHGDLSEQDIDRIRRTLESYGVTAKVDVENIPIDWKRKAEKARGAENGEGDGESRQTPRRGIVSRTLTAPIREAAYLIGTLVASFTTPTWPEVVGGFVSKGPPMVLGLLWFGKTFLPSFPIAFAAAVGFSLLLNVFHGIWINTYANFQNNIGRQRGIQYQTFFNLGYGQLTAAIFRIITWAVIAGTIAPWSLQYWRDMGIITVIGTFCGTLGIQGLNGLYDKGRIPRLGRSFIQQGRDFFMTLGGVFFGTNSMIAFWGLFATQQMLDIGLYAISRRAQKRPIIYLAEESIAASEEFQTMYPVKPGPKVDPLKQALDALLQNPLFRPIVFVVRKLRRLLIAKSRDEWGR